MMSGLWNRRVFNPLVLVLSACCAIFVLMLSLDLGSQADGNPRFAIPSGFSRFCPSAPTDDDDDDDETSTAYATFASSVPNLVSEYLDARSQSELGERNDSSSIAEIPLPDERIPDGGVFFLETSDLPFLSPKELCAVESAALHNPNRTVTAAVSATHLLATVTILQLLTNYTNVRFVRLNVRDLLNGTALEDWMNNGLLQRSQYRTAHTSDIIRCAALFKHGGTYLDLDVIVLKSLDSLKNAVGLEQYTELGAANGVMAFEKGHPVMSDYLSEINQTYDKDSWPGNGPRLIAKVLRAYCDIPPQTPLQPRKCKDVELLRKEAFYPVPWTTWNILFEDNSATSSKIAESMNDSLMLHYWNKFSSAVEIHPGSQQILGLLAREHCPIVSSYHATGLWGFHV